QLSGIPPAPRRMPQIEVTFDIDANGILNVSAKDLGTSKQQQITITASSGLSKSEVDHMVKEAAQHAAEDQRLRETAEARNRAEQLIYQTEKILNENRGKISAADIQTVESALAECKKVAQTGDKEAIDAAVETLTRASHRLAEVMYQKTSAGST